MRMEVKRLANKRVPAFFLHLQVVKVWVGEKEQLAKLSFPSLPGAHTHTVCLVRCEFTTRRIKRLAGDEANPKVTLAPYFRPYCVISQLGDSKRVPMLYGILYIHIEFSCPAPPPPLANSQGCVFVCV